MDVFRTVEAVRGASRAVRARGLPVALVPTMGCLHEGHLSLVRRARTAAAHAVVSIFVNPTQFGPQEDFGRYPRDLERDLELCRREGASAVFAPAVEEMYPEGYQTTVSVGRLTRPLCGASRPGHFDGVATVVAKLFLAVEPDLAVFGEKDYQQLQVVRRMARDLNLPVEVVGAPIVREPDGLAMSSRNAYLSAAERRRALALVGALDAAERLVRRGETEPAAVLAAVHARLEGAVDRIDYAELCDPVNLEPLPRIAGAALLALAAFVGTTRLIDNRVLTAPGGEKGLRPA